MTIDYFLSLYIIASILAILPVLIIKGFYGLIERLK